MTGSPFRQRTVVVLAIVAAASLVFSIVVAVFVDDIGPKPNAMSNSFSVSPVTAACSSRCSPGRRGTFGKNGKIGTRARAGWSPPT